MKVKKNDFVEIDFTGCIKETGEVFDTTIRKIAIESNLINESDEKKFFPLKICVGKGMMIKGIDTALEGKEIGKEYEIELQPREAFGERSPTLIKIVSLNSIRSQGIEPYPGMMLSLDGLLVRISAISGGRITIDFNNPLSGKTIIYRIKINKLIEEEKEKLSVLSKFYLNSEEIEEKEGEWRVKIDKNIPEKLVGEFKKECKSVLNIDIETVKK